MLLGLSSKSQGYLSFLVGPTPTASGKNSLHGHLGYSGGKMDSGVDQAAFGLPVAEPIP